MKGPRWILWAGGLAVLACGGCATSGSEYLDVDRWPDAVRSADFDPDKTTAWPFWPRHMRIHPLTQLVTDRKTGDLLIEARIEFLDAAGHTTKAIGQVLLDLHDGQRGKDSLETWVVDLTDEHANRAHYDDLTRTYLVRLDFDPTILPEQPELRAYFRSSDGYVLNAQPYTPNRAQTLAESP